MSLLDAIDSLRTDDDGNDGEYTVTRFDEGENVDGVWVSGATTTFTIIACVQPATNLQRVVGGADMRSLESNERTDNVRVLWTRTALHPRDREEDSDRILIDGRQYKVFRVEKWTYDGEQHYRVACTLLTGGGS